MTAPGYSSGERWGSCGLLHLRVVGAKFLYRHASETCDALGEIGTGVEDPSRNGVWIVRRLDEPVRVPAGDAERLPQFRNDRLLGEQKVGR